MTSTAPSTELSTIDLAIGRKVHARLKHALVDAQVLIAGLGALVAIAAFIWASLYITDVLTLIGALGIVCLVIGNVVADSSHTQAEQRSTTLLANTSPGATYR